MPLTLGKLLGGPAHVFQGVAVAANAIGSLVVLVLVGVVNYDMFARSLFDTPFPGTVEIVQFSLVFIVFLQLPDVVQTNRLTRSDGFLTVLRYRAPMVAFVLSRAIDLLSATFMCLLAIAVWPEFVEMWHTNDFFGVPGIFTAPWWPVKLIIVLSSALCSILFLLKVLLPSKKKDVLTASDKETSA